MKTKLVTLEDLLAVNCEAHTTNKIHVIPGGNADIDVNGGTSWKQGKCPWTKNDNKEHNCAVKNTSICDYFVSFGDTKAVDNIHCSYPNIIS